MITCCLHIDAGHFRRIICVLFLGVSELFLAVQLCSVHLFPGLPRYDDNQRVSLGICVQMFNLKMCIWMQAKWNYTLNKNKKTRFYWQSCTDQTIRTNSLSSSFSKTPANNQSIHWSKCLNIFSELYIYIVQICDANTVYVDSIVTSTVVIRPLDDRTYCAWSAFIRLGLWWKLLSWHHFAASQCVLKCALLTFSSIYSQLAETSKGDFLTHSLGAGGLWGTWGGDKLIL